MSDSESDTSSEYSLYGELDEIQTALTSATDRIDALEKRVRHFRVGQVLVAAAAAATAVAVFLNATGNRRRCAC